MTELVLEKNVFEFNSECFLQTSGTAIGTKMAPAYANIAMSIFERKLLTGSCYIQHANHISSRTDHPLKYCNKKPLQ